MSDNQPKPTLPPLPFAVFDEFGTPAYDRVQDHFYHAHCAAIAAAVAEARAVPALTDDMLRYAMAAMGTGSPRDAERFRTFWSFASEALDVMAELRVTPSPTEPAMPAERTCIECGGALQWRCPACRIAQSAQAAMPAERVALSEETILGWVLPGEVRAQGDLACLKWAIRKTEQHHGITPAQGKGEQS